MRDSFPAHVVSEQTGYRYEVRVERTRIPTSHLDSKGRESIPGLAMLFLDDGRALTTHGEGKYMASNGETFVPESAV